MTPPSGVNAPAAVSFGAVPALKGNLHHQGARAGPAPASATRRRGPGSEQASGGLASEASGASGWSASSPPSVLASLSPSRGPPSAASLSAPSLASAPASTGGVRPSAPPPSRVVASPAASCELASFGLLGVRRLRVGSAAVVGEGHPRARPRAGGVENGDGEKGRGEGPPGGKAKRRETHGGGVLRWETGARRWNGRTGVRPRSSVRVTGGRERGR